MLSGGKVSLRGGAAEGAAADLGFADLSLSGSSSWPCPSPPPPPRDLAHPKRALPYLDLQGATKDSGLAPASLGEGAGLEERWS